MKFPQKSDVEKTIVVISDLHLGAGSYVGNRKNYLEDFHFDKELIEFIHFHSSGHFLDREVELIINGDFFDLLAVPYVKYFDDEFWSEKAALEKLKLILDAHPAVMNALNDFLSFPNNKIVYILGNHDSEMILPKLQEYLIDQFSEENRSKFSILTNEDTVYIPYEGVVIKHGHEYELAHHFSFKSIALDELGNRYFIPPWGSYYVARVVNKFKESRDYINQVRPINKFIINGLIYDFLHTMRFLLANMTYFFMVRFLLIFKLKKSWVEIFESVKKEINLFKDYETLTEESVLSNPNLKVLILGHTHDPIFREYDDGSIFINTGTWTKMYNLDFGKSFNGARLTYASIEIQTKNEDGPRFENIFCSLNEWKGKNDFPYIEFRN